MQKLTKRAIIEIAAVSGVFVLLAVISAFYDLAINKALYNPDSLFGQFFANLGEFPTYLAAPVVGTIFFYQSFTNNKAFNIFWKVLSAGIVFGGWYVAIGVWFWHNFVSEDVAYATVYKLVFAAFMTAAALLSVCRVDKAVMKKLLLFAIFLLIVAALSNIIVQIMKVLWARQRFRTMVDNEKNAALIAMYGGDFKGFAPWYKPEFLFKTPFRTQAYVENFKAVDSDTFRSFPSGHTVAAAASFSLLIIPEMYERLKKYRWMFWTFPAIYTALVGVSRIVMGAHYLSDTLFGGFIGFVTAVLARWIILIIRNKKTAVKSAE